MAIRLDVKEAVYRGEGVPAWNVYRQGVHLSGFFEKDEAIRYARRLGDEMREDGVDAELRVRHEYGVCEIERFAAICHGHAWHDPRAVSAGV